MHFEASASKLLADRFGKPNDEITVTTNNRKIVNVGSDGKIRNLSQQNWLPLITNELNV